MIEDCTPPVVLNSDHDTQQLDVNHNTTINITCDPGYSAGSPGSYFMFCDGGVFDVLPPTCFGKLQILILFKRMLHFHSHLF